MPPSSSTAPSSSTPAILPTALVLAGPQNVEAGACTAVTLTFRDALNAPVTPPPATFVSFTTSPASAGFYTSGCSAQITSLPFPSQPSTTVYVRATLAGNVVFTAVASATIFDTLAVTVAPGPAAQLQATPASMRTRVGRCTVLDVRAQDAFGNTVPLTNTLTATSDNVGIAAVASDAACTAPGTSAMFSPAGGVTRVYLSAAGAGQAHLTLDTGGMTPGVVAVEVVPGVVHGTCSIGAALTQAACPIPAWVVPAQTLILVTVATNNDRVSESIPLCTFVAGALRCERRVASTTPPLPLDVGYQLFPLPAGVTVRRGSTTCQITSPAASTQVSIPMASAGFTLLGLLSDGIQYNASDVHAVTPNAAGAAVFGTCTTTVGQVVFHAQQLDWPLAPVETASNPVQFTGASISTTFPVSMDPTRTLMSVTWAPAGTVSTNTCVYTAMSTPGPSSVVSTRAAGCTAQPLTAPLVQRLLLTDNITVTHLNLDLPVGVKDARSTVTTFPEDVAVLSLDTAGGIHGIGMTDSTTAMLTDISTQLSVQGTDVVAHRTGTVGRLQMALQVLHLPPP